MKRSVSTNNLERFRQQPWQPRIGTASNQHPRIGSAGNLGIHKSVPLASSIHQKVPLASSIHKKVPLASSINKKVPLASSIHQKVPLATYNGGRVPDTTSTSTEQCTDGHVISMQVIEFFHGLRLSLLMIMIRLCLLQGHHYRQHYIFLVLKELQSCKFGFCNLLGQ
jgi:hypothetical protein